MMTALVAVLVLANQADGSVTYTCRAEAVGRALQDVSKLTGRVLTVDPEANREIVLISVDQMPVGKFMKERTSEYEVRLAGIKKSLAADMGRLESPPKVDLPADQLKGLSPQDAAELVQLAQTPDPNDRSMTLLLDSIDPEELARIGRNERVVWATNSPTPMQRLLPDGAKVMSDWIRSYNAILTSPSFSKWMRSLSESDEGGTGSGPPLPRPVTGIPAKGLLIISNGPDSWVSHALQAELDLYDRQGKQLLQTSRSVSTDGSGDASGGDSSSHNTADGQDPPKATTETPVKLSEASKFFRSLLDTWDIAGQQVLASEPGLWQQILRPEVGDPLSYAGSDVLLAVAEKEHRPLIADLPDDWFDMCERQDLSLEAVEELLSEGARLTRLDPEDLIFKSAEPSSDRSSRVDRVSLRRLLGAAETGEPFYLDALCSYALQNPDSRNPISFAYIGNLIRLLPAARGFQGSEDWNMLRLYGALDAGEKDTLLAGRNLRFAALSGSQQELAARILFGANAKYRRSSEPPAWSGSFPWSIGDSPDPESEGDLEPTELMPSGLPADGRLQCVSDQEPVFCVTNGRGAGATLSPDIFAMGHLGAKGARGRRRREGVMGTETTLHFCFNVSRGALDRDIICDEIPADGTRFWSDDLPADFFALVKQRHQEYLKYKASHPDLATAPGANTPPP